VIPVQKKKSVNYFTQLKFKSPKFNQKIIARKTVSLELHVVTRKIAVLFIQMKMKIKKDFVNTLQVNVKVY
jgi:hypothetical protein